jgi:hypothetical protein
MSSVLRVFLSSTALDLRDYRQAVSDAILRLGNLPVAMESFSGNQIHADTCPNLFTDALSSIGSPICRGGLKALLLIRKLENIGPLNSGLEKRFP